MQNELGFKLASINREIIAIQNGDHKNEVLVCGSEDYKDGYLDALYQMKEWLEMMIVHCD